MALCNPLEQYAEDNTLCPICKDDFTDPRSPPCLHTFCLKCLKGFCRDRGPGEEVKCPLCRKEFNIPQNGVDGLPGNFTIRDLVRARNEANATKNKQDNVDKSDVTSPRDEKSSVQQTHQSTSFIIGQTTEHTASPAGMVTVVTS